MSTGLSNLCCLPAAASSLLPAPSSLLLLLLLPLPHLNARVTHPSNVNCLSCLALHLLDVRRNHAGLCPHPGPGPGPGLTLLIASSMRFAISHKSFLESSVQQQPRHYGSFSFADDNVGRRRSLVAVSQSLRELQRGVALLTELPPPPHPSVQSPQLDAHPWH